MSCLLDDSGTLANDVVPTSTAPVTETSNGHSPDRHPHGANFVSIRAFVARDERPGEKGCAGPGDDASGPRIWWNHALLGEQQVVLVLARAQQHGAAEERLIRRERLLRIGNAP